jgi:hypothetical protein
MPGSPKRGQPPHGGRCEQPGSSGAGEKESMLTAATLADWQADA